MQSEFRTIIHIGLPKACSTYLQRSVAGLPGIRLIEHPELLQLRLAAFGDAPDYPAVDALRTKVGSDQNDGAVMVSDERLSSWRHTDFRWLPGNLVRSYQKRCAALLKSAFPGAQILILARNPRAWLTSIYAQYVKAGESRTLTDFCEYNREYLIQACRLDDLASFYTDQFGPSAVRVFPVEASESPGIDDWLCWVSRQCGGAIAWPKHARYQALDPAISAAQRNMNRVIDTLAENSRTTPSESSALKAELFRFVEQSLVDNAENQRRLRRYIGAQDRISLRQESPPEELVDTIIFGMSQTLKRSEFKDFLKMYR